MTVVGRNCKTREGLTVHRAQQLEPRDRRTRFGIAVTAPARTLVDFASEATRDELEQAIAEARALD